MKQLTEVFRMTGAAPLVIFVLLSVLGAFFTIFEIYHTYVNKVKFFVDAYIWVSLSVFLWLIVPVAGLTILHAIRKLDTARIHLIWAVYLLVVLFVFAGIRGALHLYMRTP